MFSEEIRAQAENLGIEFPVTREDLTHWKLREAGKRFSWQRRLVVYHDYNVDESAMLDKLIIKWILYLLDELPDYVRVSLDDMDEVMRVSVAGVKVAMLSSNQFLAVLLSYHKNGNRIAIRYGW